MNQPSHTRARWSTATEAIAHRAEPPGSAHGSDPDAIEPIGRRSPRNLPCHLHDPDLWFADSPADLERAKALCAGCPVRRACLAAALLRREPWGVWGGQILQDGHVVPFKRGRGRPRTHFPTTASA